MEKEQVNIHNYYGMVFQHCDMPNATFQTINRPVGNVDNEESSLNEELRMKDVDNEELRMKNEESPSGRHSSSGGEAGIPHSSLKELPAELDTPRARGLMGRLVKAGLLDEAWQPVGLSGSKRGVLAQHVAARLEIGCTWKAFGALWGVKSETLRAAYNMGMQQKSMSDFIGLINKALKYPVPPTP